MEEIFQLLWSCRMLGLPLTLESGEKVKVIDPGILNRDAGPDFFNAKVKIADRIWIGNIEIHMKASDWYRHHHDTDPAYDNVILHVVAVSDAEIKRKDGAAIPQMRVVLPENFYRRFAYLSSEVTDIRCASVIDKVDSLHRMDWLETLATERLQQKSSRVEDALRDSHGDWNTACFITLARGLGFGLNSLPFELLAKSINLNHLRRHSDNILQMEAIFFGQAGLLDRTLHTDDRRYQLMCREYQFLASKYSLRPIARTSWKFARTRPQNLPFRRIALLAKAMSETPDLMNRILKAGADDDKLRSLFSWTVDPYWSRRLTFGGDGQTEARPPSLSDHSINILIINVVAPLLHTYAILHNDHELKEEAAGLLPGLPPEHNSILRTWSQLGIKPRDAAESQALLHLKKEYCDRRDCLKCRFGHILLRREVVG